jgi:hypothetical protein
MKFIYEISLFNRFFDITESQAINLIIIFFPYSTSNLEDLNF